jgi:CubicO group peptidase (beta-lactamase class C family)
VFPIGSCTKSFAAAAIGRLVDRGGVQWDDAINRYLPRLMLFHPELAGRITIRHCLGHRTGLPTANMLWRNGEMGSDEILSALRWLAPVAVPGERFLYNNNMYLVAGKVVEAISGRRWTEFLRQDLFEPLGMNSSLGDSSGIRETDNVAAPHAADDGVLQRIGRYCPDVISPAGAIHSNVLDMAHWVRMHLDDGRFEERRVLSAARVAEMHTRPPRSQAPPPAEPGVPRAPISDYGLGWFFNDYAERTVVEHSGTTTGFVAWVAMIPEKRLGFVILTNQHRTGLNYALRSWILDALLDRPERDWSEIIRKDYSTGYQRLLREAKDEFDSQRPAAGPLLRPLGSYAGTYESRLFGPVRVSVSDDQLRIRYGTRFDGSLSHWKADSFRAFFPNPRLDDWLVTFSFKDEAVVGLHIKESPWAPAWYDDADDLGEFRRQ